MGNSGLTAVSPLDGYARGFDGVELKEAAGLGDGLGIVSLALPLGGEDAAAAAIQAAFGIKMPPVGKAAADSDGTYWLLRMGSDQLFVIFPHAGAGAEKAVAQKLAGTVYSTDQSDNWVAMELSGPRARQVLERICPIDLHPQAFAEGDVARTTMEHLGSIILRTGADEFLLLSASSSALSFLHAIETSIHNTG